MEMDWMQLLRQMEGEEAKRSDPQSQELIECVRQICKAKLSASRSETLLDVAIFEAQAEKWKAKYEELRPK